MCGIAGILRFDGAPPDRAALTRMGEAIVHRGPDDAGLELLGPLGLVHRRLSIIDLSPLGRQPMSYRGRYWLSYNGEIYNYLELRRDLEALGHAFRSRTDSEVLLAAYAQWGEDAFVRMNGMWAVALWDAEERKLVLSRDRLGVKPLVYARGPQRILFGSEAKALLAAEPGLAELDLDTVAQFLERPGHVFQRSTFYQRMERLEPATTLVVYDNGRSTVQRYWRYLPAARPAPISLDAAAERVRETLADAVKLRFRSDVPVGTCLSGGLDSSSIVALAKSQLGQAPRTYSVVYDDPELAEGNYVDLMIQSLGLEGRVTRPDGGDLAEVMIEATYYQDQPTAAPGIYSQWQVMRLAAPEVRVLLDGQGGDELFAGYYSFYLEHARGLLDRGLRGQLGAFAALLKSQKPMKEASGLDPLGHLARSAWNKLDRRARGSGQAPRPMTLASEELARLGDRERDNWVTPKLHADALTNAQWDMLVRTTVPGLLHYEDADSMAFSIEARVPFLDYRLVELAFDLPAEVKIDGAVTKQVLRRAMDGILPEPVRQRSDKKGFPTPFSRWIRTEPHRGFIEELLRGSRSKARGLTTGAKVEALLAEHLQDRADHGAKLWQLATLELFCRRFLDQPFRAEPPRDVRAAPR